MTVNADLPERLLAVLRAASGEPGLAYERQPEPLRGGFWAELWSFSLASPPAGWPAGLVARLMPDPGPARKETIVQGAVAEAGFPTPVVRASGGPDDGLGRAFMIMDRASGGPLLEGLDGGRALTSGLSVLRRIPDVLATAMAHLHALNPAPVREKLAAEAATTAATTPASPAPGGLAGGGPGSGGLPDRVGYAPVTVPGLIEVSGGHAAEFGRDDLAEAARWLAANAPRPAADVICHGDLHPFNLLADGKRISVLDWSTALIAPRAHDVGFTSLLLSEPPLAVPGWARPPVQVLGRLLARRFVRRYQRATGVRIGRDELRYHQAVVCLRALTEVAGWVHQGTGGDRAGHPWLVCGPNFAHRLHGVTGVVVRPR